MSVFLEVSLHSFENVCQDAYRDDGPARCRLFSPKRPDPKKSQSSYSGAFLAKSSL